jgi:hypothetical protein
MKRFIKPTMHLTARTRTAENENLLSSSSGESNDRTPVRDNRQPAADEINSKRFRRPLGSHAPFLALFLRLRHRWALMSICSKIASGFVLLFLVQHVILGVWDRFFHRIGDGVAGIKKPETSFAVVINTYKRPDMLREAVQHYAENCGRRAGVSQVFIIWAEQGTQLPEPSSFYATSNVRNSANTLANRAEIQVLQKTKDSLNSRFEPIEHLQSTAVFMVDDDLRVACPSLLHAFHAWNAHPDSMVGYYPRLASPPRSDPTSPTELIYHTWPVVYMQHKFNIVLTKASFLHSKYLDLYTSDGFPQAIKDHVDQHMNCEDIAMSMLVANYTKYKLGAPASPFYVEGSVSDKGLIGGISSGPGHMTTRSGCLTKLNAIFKENGWGPPLSYEVPLGRYSWIKHAPGLWWQYRPSNTFEWFAFANTFT